MATEVKKVKFVYFDYVHPKAFHQKCNFLESALTFLQFSSAFIFGALITL